LCTYDEIVGLFNGSQFVGERLHHAGLTSDFDENSMEYPRANALLDSLLTMIQLLAGVPRTARHIEPMRLDNIIISKIEPGIVAWRREIFSAMAELRKRPNWN
jgi:hypothetical protein